MGFFDTLFKKREPVKVQDKQEQIEEPPSTGKTVTRLPEPVLFTNKRFAHKWWGSETIFNPYQSELHAAKLRRIPDAKVEDGVMEPVAIVYEMCSKKEPDMKGMTDDEVKGKVTITTSDKVDAAYRERNRIVAALSRLYPSHLAKDPQEPDWPIVCVHTPAGQMSWHIPKADLDLFDLRYAPNDWDKHTTDEKYARLEKLGTTAENPQVQESAGGSAKTPGR